MSFSFFYIAFVRLLQLVQLSRGDQEELAIEVVMLRHEVSVLRRQVARPALRPADRAVLAGLGRLLSAVRRGRFFVQPETLLRWHRDLVKRGGRTRTGVRADRACRRARSQWSFALPKRTRLGDFAVSTGNSPPWACGSLPRACGPPCAGTASDRRPDVLGRPGRSSYEPRPRPCWPATSSPSTPSSCGACTYCFIEVDTRRTYLAGVTANPVVEWVTQQARNLSLLLSERSRAVKFLLRDRDTKFSASFDEVFRTEGIRVIKTPVQAPRANAFAERFVGTVRRECLDRLLSFGRLHLEQVLAEYLVHYNEHRPHRALDQQAPLTFGATPTVVRDPDPMGLRRTEVLGGLIHEYRLQRDLVG